MAPNKPTPKAGKSPAKPKEPRDSDLKKQLLFLWACHKVSDVQIDIPAVAKYFGIKNNAAQMRFKRMKKKLDEMEASAKGDEETHASKANDDDHMVQTKEPIYEANTEDEGDAMSE
ncbi:hypothetical protein N7536_003799 [Penicillium majusculum]|uniref:Myb-like DNA-binding domain-containing protein n=1 Tax=Penicillium solitum TaxID=60172 RepID=A0A1V6RJ59_9EURO|nr:uncharacterized protein PENSOL_c003G04315 [Penicillium solitum]KAJ5700786.1 hypothetical protein N7536_003799 [Penicillium majusculum]OQE01882.1 hypothetical protein PENSOL_c003G04315 [Penicillium solitum]